MLMKLVKVWYDEYAESPREWSNLGTMVCFHRRYCLGDRHDFHTPDEFREWVSKEVGWHNIVILPLYIYDHGRITMNTTGFSCPWDSSQVGWIYVTKARLREEFGVKRVTRDVLRRTEEILHAEVETYDQYLRGEIYGFSAYEIVGGNIVEIDSCGGFYGDRPEENGMLEYVPDELREPLRAAGLLHDGLVVTEAGDELEAGRELRNYLWERGLLPGCVLEKCSALRELCVI
ncbi:hypothetical protein [Desulfofundulus salinus]|nr:hypothetical protein [Desulfofundulus salinum]